METSSEIYLYYTRKKPAKPVMARAGCPQISGVIHGFRLNCEMRVYFADQLGRRDGEPLREPAKLLLRDLQHVLWLIRPLVLAIFKALVEQQEACLIPEQALDAVLATTAEQEKRRLVRVQMEPRDNQGGKPVDGLPHVCMAASQIDMFRREFSD